ncbi:hypothetical protein AVDCRST_MAG81-4384 [uncultured Synechococcales cyanobacterium]|uniref:GCN5-related N-acetyltransferase n=1 Tax=uncultured Synechococcales cyanobacterium TaxID=1936017 RepID=A0A6J4VVR7_9CYAN|nr:hypothetical protein AVDCRST_MAG81-4384 [uncultured Synechococcales cyanobacterium]
MTKEALIQEYLRLTKTVLPQKARESRWILTQDHCFQRVILDSLFQDCWYYYLDKPAYQHLTEIQLINAIFAANQILASGNEYLKSLNCQSLKWRGKASGCVVSMISCQQK